MTVRWIGGAALIFSCAAFSALPPGVAVPDVDLTETQAGKSAGPVVRVDNSAVSFDEFQDRLNMAVRLTTRSNPLDLKKDLAASLIAEKILAAEAEQLRLDKIPEARLTIQEFEREAVYEKLMDEEVVNQVRVSEKELQTAYARFRQQRTVRYLEFSDSLSAAHALQSDALFDSTRSPKHPAAAKTIDFGEALPSVEEAVFTLHPGQVSKPINVDGTYYLFKLEKVALHPTHAAHGFAYWRPAVEKRVKARKVAQRLEQVLPQFLKGMSFEVNRKVYDAVVEQIAQRLPFNDEEKLQAPDLINQEFSVLPPTLEQEAGETFLRFGNGTTWTVGDIWTKLRYGPYLLNYRSVAQFKSGFGDLLRRMVVFETLVERGYVKGLQGSEYVKREKRLWTDNMLSRMYIQTVADSVHPTEDDVKQWYEAHGDAYMHPETRTVMEIIVGERTLAESLVDRLRAGEDAKSLALAYSLPLPGRRPGEPVVLAPTNLREGERAAFTLRSGGIYGPVALDSNRFMVMKLLSVTPESPEPLEKVADRVRSDLVRARTGVALEKTLESLVKKHTVVIDGEQLTRAEVLEGSLLVRKSHFPNRYTVPFTTSFNHRAAWCRSLFPNN